MIIGRLRDTGEDRGSMPLLLLVMMVGIALGGLMVPMMITQDHPGTSAGCRPGRH